MYFDGRRRSSRRKEHFPRRFRAPGTTTRQVVGVFEFVGRGVAAAAHRLCRFALCHGSNRERAQSSGNIRFPVIIRIVRGQQWQFDERRRFLSPPDPEPYDPCWCFSGNKFKFCHQDRHKGSPGSLEARFLEKWHERPTLRRCYHPDARSGCGKIIRAHAVQRGGLSFLARDGKVYGLRPHPTFFLRREMQLEPDLIGISEASTFYGFCALHDSLLFRDLETRAFDGAPEQLVLLNLRAIARRLYTNEDALEPWLPEEWDRGLSPSDQRWFFADMEDIRSDAERHLENTRWIKKLNDAAISHGGVAMNAMVVRLTGDPEVACSGVVNEEGDFEGRHLPHIPPPVHMSFHFLPSAQGAAVAFAWLGRHPAAEALCSSLLRLPSEDVPHAVLRFAIQHVDLLFWSPSCWESLSDGERTAVIDRATRSIQPDRIPSPTALVDDRLRITRLSLADVKRIGPWATFVSHAQ